MRMVHMYAYGAYVCVWYIHMRMVHMYTYGAYAYLAYLKHGWRQRRLAYRVLSIMLSWVNSLKPRGNFSRCWKQCYSYDSTALEQASMGQDDHYIVGPTCAYYGTHIHTNTHTYSFLHTYIQFPTHIHTNTHTYTQTHIHKHIQTHIHTYIQTHIHTYKHTYT